jgi:tetratricopeptide (TPR) repeat protein
VKYTKKIIIILSVFTILTACSTKKNTVISRNYQALTTKYNVLFNGKKAFNLGVEAINYAYEDDWFKQLPIEPIKFEEEEEEVIVPFGNSGIGAGFNDPKGEVKKTNTPFDTAEEKAVKAIQKHGMKIEGEERNRQIDDAYLLLGKARYYDQRFIPAIEAFNYIITNYPFASLINETKIWRAKANTRIGNEEFAIASLKLLLKVKDTAQVNLPDEIKELGYSALAMAYVKADSIQKAKKMLIRATRTLKNKEQGARNLFVLGQIYSLEDKKDSALVVFDKIINFRKAPYKYKIHANIALAKNATNDASTLAILKKMQKLIKNRDNRAYLDELYYQVGFLHEKKDSINSAIEYYNKSLRAPAASNIQKTFTYEKLGNINFKNSKYQLASSYYDSILKIAPDTLDLRIRRIKRKHKNLASLINFENTVTKNDSILKITSLSKAAQEVYFQKYIDALKKKEEAAAQLKLNQETFGASFGGNSLQSNKGKWYFYNSQSLGFGKTEFQKNWGNRKLEDNWRWFSKIATNSSTDKDSLQIEKKNLRYDLASYLKTIPTDTTVINALVVERNQALYELGIIYKEQFKNPKLAIERLERVASLAPTKELVLPINWHLQKVYTDLGDEEKTTKHKNVILTDYSKTKFAQAIRNPNKPFEEEKSVNEIEKLYKEMYFLYKEEAFDETVIKINEILSTVQNSKLIPKFELLKAYAIGKYKDKESYKVAMNFVAVRYGNTIEGKQAKKIVTQLGN